MTLPPFLTKQRQLDPFFVFWFGMTAYGVMHSAKALTTLGGVALFLQLYAFALAYAGFLLGLKRVRDAAVDVIAHLLAMQRPAAPTAGDPRNNPQATPQKPLRPSWY